MDPKFEKEMRNSDAYKVGYLRSAIKHIIMRLECNDPKGAKLHAEDTLRTIRVDNDSSTDSINETKGL